MNYSNQKTLELDFILRVLRMFLAFVLSFVMLFSTSIVRFFIEGVDIVYLSEYVWSLRLATLMTFYYLVKKHVI